MSKSSTATSQKNPPQLSSKSAWSRGPPQPSVTTASSRSQSPAPTPTTPIAPNATSNFHGTHSRRSSTLGQGVPIKEGVSVPRNIAATKSGSSVTFGSIDDASAPMSSSPAAAPVVKPADGLKSFGSLAVQNASPTASSTTASTAASTTSSTPSSTPKMGRRDIAKLFQGPSAPSTQTQPSTESTSSPATRPASLPPSSHQPGSQYISPPFQSGLNLRPQPNGNPSGAPPRSPSYSRPSMANGQNGSVTGRPPSGPTSAPGAIPPAMPSPRMTPHPPSGQPAAMPPSVAWPGYYYQPYPGMPEGMYPYPPAWGMPQQMQPHHPHQQPLHHPPGAPVAPAPGMPMSPRNPPPSLQPAPSTPTLNHATPVTGHGPPMHAPSASVTSPPPTPSTTNGAGLARLNSSASAFVPSKKISSISIKNQDGKELDLGALRRTGHSPVSVPTVPGSPAVVKTELKRQSVRIESPEQKEKRMAEQRMAEEAERARVEREEREKREATEAKERAEREKKEEQERIEREAKEAEERERKEAEEREKAEAERKAREAEEAERARVEAEEKKRKEEEEAREKARLEEERVKKEAEERERQEAEEKWRKEAEEKAAVEAKVKADIAAATPETIEEKEEGEITEDKPLSSATLNKDPLRIDTTIHPERRRPGPLDLKNVSRDITPSLPSALATARIIDDIGSVTYPEGIKSPKVELNVNAAKGKFRYDREFLMQFMTVCKEKPDNLPPLDAIGLEPSDQTFNISRGGSGRSRVSSLQTPSSARGQGIGLGLLPSSLGKSSTSSFNPMGNFSTSISKLSSEERFAMASSARSASTSGMPSAAPGRPPPMARTSSQGGPSDRRRTRSSRGHTREAARQGSVANYPSQAPSNMTPPLEPVAPLEQTANRWVAPNTKRNAGPESDSPEIVDRKVKALLNKLTMERFDSISDQIIGWANKSEKEKNGQTLIQVIKLVFEKATDEATFSEMYARLCRKMMEQISTKVQDDGILNAEGKPFAGGQLFRKYLLNRCQEDFERGWNQKETTAAAAAVKASEDQAIKEKEKEKEGEVELYSDEYYAAAKAKRRGLGLIRFIGELFKLQMLTERIMHECIKKLLGNVENPEEEEIESLCKLLSTVGQLLDTPKARAHMDVYFSRMKELSKNKNVNSRMTFMLIDVIELRESKWVPRNKVAAPTTIAQIHEAAAREKALAEKEAANMRQSTMSRGGSRRGGERQENNPDGWAVAGASNTVRPQPKAGDLSQFGKISKAAPMTFGPTSVFVKGSKDSKGRESSVTRTASSRNMFDMLSNADVAAEPPAGRSSRPPSRKPSADFSQTGLPEAPPQRKRLNLLPRTKPLEENKQEAGEDGEEEEVEEAAAPSMSEEKATGKIDEDIKELFSLRSLDEAESYFTTLPAEYHWQFVDKLVNQAIDSKAADIQLVTDVFTRVREKGLVLADALERGFSGLAEIIDDIAIDAPKAFDTLAGWLKAAGLDKDEERRSRIAGNAPEGGDRLLSLLKV